MEPLVLPEFDTVKELHDFLVTNKKQLKAQKAQSGIKRGDGIPYTVTLLTDKEGQKQVRDKAYTSEELEEFTVLSVQAVINTTGIMDSHDDVHIPGLWEKSIKENRNILHAREHKTNDYAYIISDGEDLKVSTKYIDWTQLGYNYPGQTQALYFESTVKQERNPFMFEQYGKGWVKQHSVGMGYIWKELYLCINDEDYSTEYENWQKYIDFVVNREHAEEKGFFWAVVEAKCYEGSAVPRGSNDHTPTVAVEGQKTQQPEASTAKGQAEKSPDKKRKKLSSIIF